MPELPEDSVGWRIRQHREAEGLTLSELADKSGVSKSYLWNLENKAGHQKPSADTLYALARALGTTMSQLLGKSLLTDPVDTVDPTLDAFAQTVKLSDGDLRTLASINWRGDPPKTVERWRFVYDALKASRSFD